METEHPPLRLLTMKGLNRAVTVHLQAFFSDPLWLYLLPDEDNRRMALRKCFTALFRFSILNEQAYGIGSPPDGVAMWEGPAQRIRLSSVLSAGFHNLLFSSSVLQFIRAGRFFAKFREMRTRYAPEPHYYLAAISVLPEAQGKGLASQLIRPFLRKADLEKVGTYTETMTPENVGLYEHYGFRVMETYHVPNTDLRLWAFYRPAKG